MSRIAVNHLRTAVRHQERTGLTCTINLELPLNARLDEMMFARKHGDFALYVIGERVPVRVDRISIKDAKLMTCFVEVAKLEIAGVLIDNIVSGDLMLEYNAEAALFTPEEMNARPGVKAKAAASSEDEEDGETEEDSSEDKQSLDEAEPEAEAAPEKRKRGRPRKNAEGSSARA